MKNWKFLQWVLLFATILFVIVLMYISLNYDKKINDSYVTMIAGLWSAFATAILGCIALWQNKRYKELSTSTTKNTELVQQEIRELTNKTMQAIERLKNIEMAKYYPSLEIQPIECHGIDKEEFLELFSADQYVVQPTLIDITPSDYSLSFNELVEKYSSYIFVLKNEGEKAIRDFGIRELLINGQKSSSMLANFCDIHSGKYVVISIFGISELYRTKPIELKIRFTFNNLILEHYQCEIEILLMYVEEVPHSYVLNFSHSELIEMEKI